VLKGNFSSLQIRLWNFNARFCSNDMRVHDDVVIVGGKHEEDAPSSPVNGLSAHEGPPTLPVHKLREFVVVLEFQCWSAHLTDGKCLLLLS
jgi:hypothetical protein